MSEEKKANAVAILAVLLSDSDEADLLAAKADYLPSSLVDLAKVAKDVDGVAEVRSKCLSDAEVQTFAGSMQKTSVLVALAFHIARCETCHAKFQELAPTARAEHEKWLQGDFSSDQPLPPLRLPKG